MKLDYIAASRIAGASHLQVMVQDLLPGVLPIIITLMSVEIGIAVVVESILSFVGVSVEPDIPTWGSMIADGLVTLFNEPWGLVFPMGAIILTVLCANMLGDGLSITLDPRVVWRRLIDVWTLSWTVREMPRHCSSPAALRCKPVRRPFCARCLSRCRGGAWLD